MSDTIENHDELAHIETMSTEELRQELRDAIKFHRQCLVDNWHEKKELHAINKEMQLSIESGTQTLNKAAEKLRYFSDLMDKATFSIVMWRRTAYALAFVVVVLAGRIVSGGAA